LKANINQLPNEGLMRILELTRKLSAPFNLPTMLAEILQAGLDIMKADSGSVWLHNENRDVLEMHLPEVHPMITVKTGEGLVGECLATNKVINVRDCYTDPRFNPDVDKRTGYKTESILSIPLIGFEQNLVGVLQMLNKSGGPFDDIDELLALSLAAQSAVALQRAQMTETLIAKERLDEEIELAREIQFATLPGEMPVVPGYDFGSGFIPAEYTGGDLFDLVTLGDEVFILMGDATGHGFGPALSATQMHAMLRVAFRVGASLDQAYIHVNNQLNQDLPDNKFLTAFVGFLNWQTHIVRYHSGGQGPLLHFCAENLECSFHPPTSFPVGILDIDAVDAPTEIKLAHGDIFAVISDGVYEYHNKEGEQFGEDRVAQIFKECTGSSMDELKNRLLDAVFAFGEGAEQLDDITIVLVHRK
jgi:phosphoserine phosphatase|tara:strand:+ start:3176 stop:4429 length:1254 start_codon:yes stop_codon:yes gene_type:complete